MSQIWDPQGTLRRALWIGGGQWAGKSTVARALADRRGLAVYHYDYHDSRARVDRRIARQVERGESIAGPDLEWMWVTRTPRQMADSIIQVFADELEWALDDLRALYSGRPILAEGWGFRPDLIWPLLDPPRRMIVMVPTPAFRRHQLEHVERARSLPFQLSDPARGQRNRVERDILVAEDAVRSARSLGIRVLEVDGSLDGERVADAVEEHFAPYLS